MTTVAGPARRFVPVAKSATARRADAANEGRLEPEAGGRACASQPGRSPGAALTCTRNPTATRFGLLLWLHMTSLGAWFSLPGKRLASVCGRAPSRLVLPIPGSAGPTRIPPTLSSCRRSGACGTGASGEHLVVRALRRRASGTARPARCGRIRRPVPCHPPGGPAGGPGDRRAARQLTSTRNRVHPATRGPAHLQPDHPHLALFGGDVAGRGLGLVGVPGYSEPVLAWRPRSGPVRPLGPG
jgi:hypothetical protein